MPEGTDWSPRIVMFGDLGNVNAQSLPRLQSEVDMYDAVLHIGKYVKHYSVTTAFNCISQRGIVMFDVNTDWSSS